MKAPLVDVIDAAFLDRWARASLAEPVADAAPAAQRPDGDAESTPAAAFVTAGSPLDRLMRLVPDQWAAVADRIDAAVAVGQRVIAFVGGRRGAGCTTLVAGAAAALSARQRAVRCVTPADLSTLEWGGRDLITLVDAGIWFPSGPLRIKRLAALAQGCDAVILVRHGADPACPAHGEALARLGVACLGEVETFTP